MILKTDRMPLEIENTKGRVNEMLNYLHGETDILGICFTPSQVLQNCDPGSYALLLTCWQLTESGVTEDTRGQVLEAVRKSTSEEYTKRMRRLINSCKQYKDTQEQRARVKFQEEQAAKEGRLSDPKEPRIQAKP